MDIDHAKINLRNGKKLTIGYGVFTNNKETFDVICILAISLTSIYATKMLLILPLKMTLIYRD